MINVENLSRYKFLTLMFTSYAGQSPLPTEIGRIMLCNDLANQIKEIRKEFSKQNSLLPVANYTELYFVDRLLELTRYNLAKAVNFENPLTQLSTKGVIALADIYKGANLNKINIASLEHDEIVHILYYKYLRRIADTGAINKWRQETSKIELINKLSSALMASKEFQLHGKIRSIGNEFNTQISSQAIYVDVTNTVATGAYTGIQRVVRRLSDELNSSEFVFIFFNGTHYVEANIHSGVFSIDEKPTEITFCRGDVFIDIDASWGDRLDRMRLYKSLKNAGIRIINLHYDAVPVLHPAYSHPTTVWRYLEHFVSMLIYSDRVICISQAVKNDLKKITNLVKSRTPTMSVIDMGADILDIKKTYSTLPEFLAKKKFILMVGTIEPRKNYLTILDNINFLRKLGLSIVIVGKRGWESASFFKRLEEEEKLGSVFWLQNVDDQTLLSLYEKCFLYLTTSHYEGYGLPVIEALQHGCCVISSNGGALPEAGKGVSLVYESENELKNLLTLCVTDPDYYNEAILKSKNINITNWKKSATQLKNIISEFFDQEEIDSPVFSQLVVISTRPDSFKKLIASFVKFNLIESCIVLTKESCLTAFLNLQLDFSIPIKIFTDEEILPELLTQINDHTERNFLLRKNLLKKAEVNNLFIMADDDYIIQKAPPKDYFLANGKIKAGYCHHSLSKWLASPFGATSFDCGRWNESELLKVFGSSELVFDSHRPQLIKKKDFIEIISEFESIKGIAEWSVYFNIAMNRYPMRYEAIKSTVLHWPQSFSSWVPDFFEDNVLFENFYCDQPNLEMPFADRVFIFKNEYLLYQNQNEINSKAKTNLAVDLDSMSLNGALSQIALKGIWSRLKCLGKNDARLAYKIFDQSEKLIVDGSHHHQYCHSKTGLMIKNPTNPGVYTAVVFEAESNFVLGNFSILVN